MTPEKIFYIVEPKICLLVNSVVSVTSTTQLCLTLFDSIDCSTLGLPVHHQLPELAQTHIHRVGDAIQPSHHLLSPSPPAFNLSKHQGLFHWVSSSHQEAKYWCFSFSISLSNAYSGLISFRIDWFDLLAVQGIINSLPQHHSSKASILWHSAVFMVQLSHPYMTTVETIDLTRWTFAGKVMSLLFNRLSRFVIVFHPRSKCLLAMAAVTICSDFGAPKNSLSLFPLFPYLFAMELWNWMSSS